MTEQFSKRQGIVARIPVQLTGMNGALRTALWNVLTRTLAVKIQEGSSEAGYLDHRSYRITERIWDEAFKLPIDQIPDGSLSVLAELREKFDQSGWYQVYDLLEILSSDPVLSKAGFCDSCNAAFQRESSGYRFLEGIIVPLDLSGGDCRN